jgi:hypothetical protein
MTNRLSHLIPPALAAGLLAAIAIAFAAASGSAAGIKSGSQAESDGGGDIAAACLVGSEDCADTVDVGGPDIAPVCAEGPAVDCIDTVDPGEPIADCQYDPCYDTPALLPDPLGSDCKQIADDMVACVSDPEMPVSSEPSVKPAEPPDAGQVSEPDPGVPPEEQLAEDIAERERCEAAGAC